MKFQLKKIIIVSILLLCFVSTSSCFIPSNRGTASVSQTVQKIAVILDILSFKLIALNRGLKEVGITTFDKSFEK